MRRAIPAVVVRYLSRLRFPRLFALAAVVFAADLLLPDAIPFVDEILLGLGTALLGAWKRERSERDGERSRVAPGDGAGAEPDGGVRSSTGREEGGPG